MGKENTKPAQRKQHIIARTGIVLVSIILINASFYVSVEEHRKEYIKADPITRGSKIKPLKERQLTFRHNT